MGGAVGAAKLALLASAGLVLLPTVARADSEWRSDVLALTDSNIEAAIQSTDVLMVEFYGALSHAACASGRRERRSRRLAKADRTAVLLRSAVVRAL